MYIEQGLHGTVQPPAKWRCKSAWQQEISHTQILFMYLYDFNVFRVPSSLKKPLPITSAFFILCLEEILLPYF